jgi:TP901 family phage tail tape measure protein
VAVSQAELRAVISASSNLQSVLGADSAALGKFGQAASGIGSQFAAIGKTVAVAGAAIGGGLVAGAAAGVKAAGDLQQSVANISTIAPTIDTGQVFEALNQMQQRVPQTAAQLGDSLYNVFSSISDLTADQALTLTETFAKGAVGAQTDAETFGTAIIGVLNAYKLSTEDATHVSDVFFNTVAAGVVTGEELAASLGPVTQAAKAAGVSLDEMGGLIAGVTKEGGPAAQNINNLSNFFQKFTTTKAQEELKAIGVATVDAAGNFRPIMEVMGDLRRETAHLAEADMASLLQEMFPDMQARQGAQTILSQLDFINTAIETNKTQAGSAGSAFEKMNATFNSQAKILGNTFQSLLTTVGAELLPVITPLLMAFSAQLPAAFATARAAFASLSIAGTPLIQFFQDLWGTLQQVFAGEWSPDASINPVINALGQLAGIVQTVIIPNLLSLGTIVQKVMGGDFAGAFAEVGPILQRAGAAFGPILQGWAEAFGAWVGPATQSMLQQLATLGAQGLAWVQSQLPGWTAQLLAWGQQFVAWVQPQIAPMLAQLQALASQALAWVASQVPVWTAQLLTWGQTFVAWVAPQIPPLIVEAGKLAARLIDWITTQRPLIETRLTEWATAFVKWVATEAVPKLATELPKIHLEIDRYINAVAIPVVAGAAKEIGVAIVKGIISGTFDLPNQLGRVIANAALGALAQARAALDIRSPSGVAAREIGEPLAEGVISGFIARLGAGGEMAEAIRSVVVTSLKYGMRPDVFLALAKAESNLNPSAVGDSGASKGLFQLHSRGMGAGMGDARFDPWANAEKFIGDARVRELYDRLIRNVEHLTPELISTFGGQAEVSVEAFWGRYGEAWLSLGGGTMATLGKDLPPVMLEPPKLDPDRWAAVMGLQQGMYDRLLATDIPTGTRDQMAALTDVGDAVAVLQRKVADGSISTRALNIDLLELAARAGLTSEPLRDFDAGLLTSGDAVQQLMASLRSAGPEFEALYQKMAAGDVLTEEQILDLLNLIARHGQYQATLKKTADAVEGGVPGVAPPAVVLDPKSEEALAAQKAAVVDVGTTTVQQNAASMESWKTLALTITEAREQLRKYSDYLYVLTPQRLEEQSGGWRAVGDEVLRSAEAVRRYSAAVTDIPPFPSGAETEDLPELASGGRVTETGAAVVHEGEIVATEDRLGGGGPTYNTYNTYNNNLHVNPRPGEERQIYENFRIMSALFGGS